MNSSLTQSFVSEGKLLVRVAENGHSFELDCDETTPVEAVMRFVESVSGISFNDQLLLSMDMKLEPQRPLSAYKLPAKDRELFIFNKARLQNNSPLPPPEQVDDLEVPDLLPPASLQDRHPLDDASDPALKALPSYERQFRYHFHKGHSIYTHSLRKYENCKRLVREQKVQERAIEVATINLDQYYKGTYQNFLEFMKRYKHQHRFHSDLLLNSGRDVEKLRYTKLHPSLQTDTRKCLLDFVKEENLGKVVENCGSSHKQFANKIAQFQQTFAEFKRKVEELFACRASLSTNNLEHTIKDHQRYLNEQKSITQSLSKDVGTVKTLVDDCVSCQLSSSLRPHDAVSALGPMYEVHDKSHLPRIQACDDSISELLDFCKNKKNNMNNFVHSYMQKITYLTYVIKDAKLQFPVFKEAMIRQDDLFADLRLIRGIGPAYRACLAEVVRRKASIKLHMGLAGQLAEKLATKREDEIRRRDEFLKTNGPYVPRDVLTSMGLNDSPAQCDVNIVPYDTNLLNIDISDLDHYAPEYLVEFPSKLAASKGSVSMSNESSLSSERNKFLVDPLEKDNYEAQLEASELVEIAGTSKIEVENAKLKADLASAIARICSLWPEADYELLDYSKQDDSLKSPAEKTAEALQLKDEYQKHLMSMLKEKQMQCDSYEKRIRELEARLNNEYLHGQKLSNSQDASESTLLAEKDGKNTTEILGGGEPNISCESVNEHMDELSSISHLSDKQPSKVREGVDENMMDSSNHQLDSSMLELEQEKNGKDNVAEQLGMSLGNSTTAQSTPQPVNVNLSGAESESVQNAQFGVDILVDLRTEVADKSIQVNEMESKLKDALEEVSKLRRELEMGQKLLDESQMNCAHLENCLHEAREEAQTHLCAADRRASQYSALRAAAVKTRSLLERLRSCVYSPGGVAGFAESLRALSQSLANAISDDEDDGTAEFRNCIRVLADKVGFLSRHREELLEKYPKLEASNDQLRKELDEKKELVKTLYAKHQLEKLANKEKISFGRLEVHEIAAFVLNSAGHYVAINKNCSNYYLSSESVALFTEHLPNQPSYIVGQIVHVERQAVKPNRADGMDHGVAEPGSDRLTSNSSSSTTTSNPYGLSVGCEYFIVTIAMLPDTAIRPPQQAS